MPTPVPVPLSVVALDLAAAFADAPLPAEAAGILADLDRSGLVIHGYRIVETSDGRVVQLLMPPGSAPQALIAVPGLTAMELLLSVGDDAVLEVAEPGPHVRYTEVRGLRLAVRFDPALLRPMDGSARAELSWTGALRWYLDGRLALVGDPELSLTPCEIGSTGIVVELSGVQLDLATDRSPASLRMLGLDATFQGVYARSGSVRLLPQASFGGMAGLRVDVRNLAVGTSGVSGTIGSFHTLEPTPDGRLDPTTALVGELWGGAWQVGIGTVAVELRESAVTAFRIDGMIRLPVFDALVGVGFGMRTVGAVHENTIRIGSVEPVAIGLGAGSLHFADFAVDGVFGAPDTLVVSGVVNDLELDLAPVRVTAARVSIAIEHHPDRDELRAALSDVAFGPLGTLDAAELIIRERRGGTTAGREVVIEATLTWDDIRNRIDLPAGIPGPAGNTVKAELTWTENAAGATGIVLRLSAHIDDPGELFGFLPPLYRPRVAEAQLDVEIVYLTADAFDAATSTGALAGSVGLSTTVLLPMLPGIPGVIAVRTGDTTGRVRARLTASVASGGQQSSLVMIDPVAIDLRLPGQPGAPVVTLALTAIAITSGATAGESTFALAGTASVPPTDTYLAGMIVQLGVPGGLAEVVGPLARALPQEATFALAVKFAGTTITPSIELTAHAGNPPAFALLDAVGSVVNSGSISNADATGLPGLVVPDDFFAVRPGELQLKATLAEPMSISLGASLAATAFGETFDLSVAVVAEHGDFRITVGAGTSDPILVRAPVPDPAVLLGAADVAVVAASYGLDAAGRRQLEDLEQFLTDLAAELGQQGVLVFEISDFELSVIPTGPRAEGTVRLVQLPRFLEQLTPLSDLAVTLGAEVDKIYVSIARESADNRSPLLSIPIPGDGDVTLDVYFRDFRLAYAWGRNEFAFGLNADVLPSRTLNLTAGGSGVHIPAVRTNVEVGATATVPTVPIPQGVLSFRRPQRTTSDRAVDDLGLQIVVGDDDNRYATAYLRELEFSPTYFLLWPGFKADGGLVLGGPNPANFLTVDDYLAVRDWNRNTFFARFTVQGGALIFFDAMIGVLLNPLAVVPPFLTLNPPYWIAPPFVMGDLFAEKIGVSVNLPALAFFDLTFERPLPHFSLQALLELAALVASGFTSPIPAGSELRKMFYARLSVALEVQLLGLSAAPVTVAPPPFEVNAADLVNGVIDVLAKASATLTDAATLIDRIAQDPGALVRMVPTDLRRMQHDIAIGGFTFSGSLHLLAPEELEEELVLYFENKRRRRRGGGALTDPPVPQTRPAINNETVWSVTNPVPRQGIVDRRSIPPDMTAVGGRAVTTVIEAQRARDAAVEQLRLDRRRRVEQSVDSVTDALTGIRVRDAIARTDLLEKFGLAAAVSDVDAAMAAGTPGRPGTATELSARLRPIIAKAFGQRERATISDSGLSAPPEEVAAQLIAHLVVNEPSRAVPRINAPTGLVLLRPAADRAREIEGRLPGPGLTQARAAISTALTGLDGRLRIADLTIDSAQQAITDATNAITAELTERFNVREGTIDALLVAAANPDALPGSIKKRALSTWRTSAVLTDRVTDVRVFAGEYIAGVLQGLDRYRPHRPNPAVMVETVTGYEIRDRVGSGFAVAVPSASALYTVVPDGNTYRLRVRDRNRNWTLHDLPAALKDGVPEGPRKADLLRGQLVVAPSTLRRQRTAAEANAVDDAFEHANDLYQSSVLDRDEYEVKPSGGIHGRFMLADILRDPVTGKYTVPAGPTLIGGFQATLFGSEVRLAGLVVSDGSRASAFLYGHTTLVATIGRYKVTATGDFVACTGSAWRNVPLPSGRTMADDAIGFSGLVTVQHDAEKVFEGSAEGRFTRTGTTISADLTVRVQSEGSMDLGIDEAKFGRISWSVDSYLHLTVTPQSVSVEADVTAAVKAELATYDVEWITDPAKTLCATVMIIDLFPPGWHWESLCVTIPETAHPEIDFGAVDWEPLAEADCALHVSSSPSGLDIRLNLSGLGGEAVGFLGEAQKLPRLT